MANFRRQLLVIFVILPAVVRAQRECCKNGILVKRSNVDFCEDGQLVRMDCDDQKTILSKEPSSYYRRYELITKNNEKILHAVGTDFEWHGLRFCEGYMLKAAHSNESIRIALTCNSRLEGSNHEVPRPKSWSAYEIYLLLMEVMNFLSILTLAITAFLYFYLPEMDNTEGRCTLHLSLCMGIAHTSCFYILVVRQVEILPDLCITKFYLAMFFVLSSFCWTAIISFDMWNRTRNRRRFDESKLMCRYYRFGYGAPCLLILLSNILAHSSKFHLRSRFELSCGMHREIMIYLFTILPVSVILLSNLFFFIDVQRRLWKIQPLDQQNGGFPYKKLKYRLSLNGRLFFIMGIPWICILISVYFYYQYYTRIFEWLAYFFGLLLGGGGVSIFLILVVLRPRTCKAISRRWPAFKNLLTETAGHDAESLTDELQYDVQYNANGVSLETRETNNKTSAVEL